MAIKKRARPVQKRKRQRRMRPQDFLSVPKMRVWTFPSLSVTLVNTVGLEHFEVSFSLSSLNLRSETEGPDAAADAVSRNDARGRFSSDGRFDAALRLAADAVRREDPDAAFTAGIGFVSRDERPLRLDEVVLAARVAAAAAFAFTSSCVLRCYVSVGTVGWGRGKEKKQGSR